MSEITFRVVREWDVARVRLTEEADERVRSLRAACKCLGCEEPIRPGETVKCGLHDTCYQAARRAIRSGRFTQNQLIRDGKMLAPTEGGRRPTNKFSKELSGR
jgi:hypothetical protein